MQAYEELKALLPVFHREILIARELKSPNPEDDLSIKTAIVGFSHHSPTEEWGLNHFTFLRRRLNAEFAPDDLLFYGPRGENIRLFYALCFGFLLGLYQSDKINDREFGEAEALLPGLISLNTSQLLEVECSHLGQ